MGELKNTQLEYVYDGIIDDDTNSEYTFDGTLMMTQIPNL